ncbi:hypothetical protein JCM8202v2_002168 [Rhodotorula sphaerocarpa]
MRKKQDPRLPWLLRLARKNKGAFGTVSSALLGQELEKRGLTDHVVDAQSLSFPVGLETARGLCRTGTARGDANAAVVRARMKVLRELADSHPRGQFHLVADRIRGRAWMWRKLGRKEAPTIETGEPEDAKSDYKWTESALDFDLQQASGEPLPANATLVYPPENQAACPHVVPFLENDPTDRNSTALWTTDGALVFNASPELVRYVVIPPGDTSPEWSLIDLDAVTRDTSVKVSNAKTAWRVMNILIGADFIDGLPGYGPTRLNNNSSLAEVCNEFETLSDSKFAEALASAAADVVSSLPTHILIGLERSKLHRVIEFECHGIDMLADILEVDIKQAAIAADAAAAERKQRAGYGNNLVFARKPRHHDAPAAPAGTKIASDSGGEAADPPPGDDSTQGTHRRPYSGKGRPLQFERTDYRTVESPIGAAAAKAARYEAKRIATTAPEPVVTRSRKRGTRATDKAVRLAFGVSDPTALRRAVRRKAIQALADSSDDDTEDVDYEAMDTESLGLSDNESIASSGGGDPMVDDNDDEDVGGNSVDKGASADTDVEMGEVDRGSDKSESLTPDRARAQTAKPTEGKRPDKATRKTKSTTERLDSASIKRQFSVATVQTDHVQAYARLAFLDLSATSEEMQAQLRSDTSTHDGVIDLNTHEIQLANGGRLVAIDRDLRLVDEAVRAQFSYETIALFEMLRRIIAHALDLSPVHGFLVQAGVGLDGDGADDRFRKTIGSLHTLVRLLAPATGTTRSNAWRQGRRRTPPEQRKERVQELELARVAGAARNRASASFEEEWKSLADDHQEMLALLELPLFALEEVETVLAEQPCVFSSMPSSVFYESWGASHKATITAMRSQIPSRIEQVAAAIARDPVGKSRAFVDYVGAPLGCPVPEMPLWPSAVAELWTTAQTSPVLHADMIRALTTIISSAMLGARLVGNSTEDSVYYKKIWLEMTSALERTSPPLVAQLKGHGKFKGERPSCALVIADSFAELVMAVIAVVRAQYAELAARLYVAPSETKRVTRAQTGAVDQSPALEPLWKPNNSESAATVEDWARGKAGLLVDVTGLVEAQLSWRAWEEEEIPLTCHGKSLVVPIYEQLRRLEHAHNCATALVENISLRTAAIEKACSTLEPAERIRLEKQIREAVGPPADRTVFRRERQAGASTTEKRHRRPRKSELQLRGSANAGVPSIGPRSDETGVPLIDTLHDSPFVRIEQIEPGAIFPQVSAGRNVAKVERCAKTVLKHLAPDGLPRTRPKDRATSWDLLAPFVLPNLYADNSATEFLPHGQVVYLPDAISSLKLAPARIKKGTTKHEGQSPRAMVEEALRSPEQKKRLAGYTSYKAASAFTKGTMTFHYIIDPASNRVYTHRVDPIIGFDTKSGGRQRGSWSAAAKDPRQKVTNQTVRDKASLKRRLYGRLPDTERGELQQLIRAELERPVGTATQSPDEHHTIAAGIDRGEEVLVTLAVVGPPSSSTATSFKIKNAQFKRRDQQDKSAQERQDAKSPLYIIKTALQAQGL